MKMNSLDKYHAQTRAKARSVAASFADWLNKVTGGKLRPADVTWVAFVAHLPIAVLIAQDQLFVAGCLILFFGLFDMLDGALARAQKSSSPAGMLLDSTTDRLKEVFLFSGFAWLFASNGQEMAATATVLALGLSVCVSYVRAKGETATVANDAKIDHHKLNRRFESGLGSYEARTALLVLGCWLSWPELAIMLIIPLAAWTIFVRFNNVVGALK